MKGTEFSKFPRTPHLFSVGKSLPRGDKLVSPETRELFLRSKVSVEEKIDGTNIGISLSRSGTFRFQNRGNFIHKDRAEPQYELLWSWAGRHRQVLSALLDENLILFGEWCYAVHSIQYNLLPDWFIAFDIFDIHEGRFWSRARREKACKEIGLAQPPLLHIGPTNLTMLNTFTNRPSSFGAPKAEGIYVRLDDDDWSVGRAKVVSDDFVESIVEHWKTLPLRKNHLA